MFLFSMGVGNVEKELQAHQATTLQELPVPCCMEASRMLGLWMLLEHYGRGSVVGTFGTGTH